MNPLDTAIEVFREEEPKLYAKFFKKRVDFHHPQYSPIRYLQMSLAAHQCLPPVEAIDKAWCVAAEKMVEFEMPIYHLASSFCQAVYNTAPPGDLVINTLHLPFPTFSVALPKDESMRMFKTNISFITAMRLDHMEMVRIHNVKTDFINEGNKLAILITCPDCACSLPLHYAFIILREDTYDRVQASDYYEDWTNPLDKMPEFANTKLTEAEEHLMPMRVGVFVLRLLAVLNAAPNLLPVETSYKKVRPKNPQGGVHHEYHPPLWIGHDYKVQTDVSAPAGEPGTHASPRMHWRRGHIRRQHYGPKNTLERMVWIEPVLVNKPL